MGFVGARFAAKFHWEAIRRVYEVPVEIVGVTSKTPDARDAFARQAGICAFDTFGELCAAVEVVDLCTPPSSHEELAVEALGLGKHIIIEKPLTGYFGAASSPKAEMLAEATASCARILEAAQASGKRVCYAENWVYAPAIQKEREIIQKSGGQILRILGEQSHGGIALSVLWPLEILRRRVAGRERMPSGKRSALSEAGGGRIEGWNAHSTGHGERAHARNHAVAELPR